MTRFHHIVDASKSLEDPDRVQLVPFTAEEEAARDAEEVQWASDQAAKASQLQNRVDDFDILMASLRSGTLDAAGMSILADILEALRPA